MKRPICLLMSVIMGISLCACGNGNEQSAESTDGSTSVVIESADTSAENQEQQTNEVVASGTCGYNATWVRTQDGTLTISGSGKTVDCYTHNSWNVAPWSQPYVEDESECWPSVKKVVIEEGITELGAGSFYEWGIQSVSLPESLEVIGAGAFDGCVWLTEMNIPSNLQEVGKYALDRCGRLENWDEWNERWNITDDYQEGSAENYYTGTIDGFVIEDGYANDYTGDGGEVTIPDEVLSISSDLFAEHPEITGITLPHTWEEVLMDEFYGVETLKKVTIPDSVTTIYARAFMNCSNLEEIVIPDSVAHIGQAAFSGCTSLETIQASGQIKTMITSKTAGASAYLNALGTEETLDNGLVVLNDMVVGYTGDADEITIPDSITTIGTYAFLDTTITKITIPDTVQEIGPYAVGFAESDTSDIAAVPINDITIYGSSGSAADEYAERYCVYFTPAK